MATRLSICKHIRELQNCGLGGLNLPLMLLLLLIQLVFQLQRHRLTRLRVLSVLTGSRLFIGELLLKIRIALALELDLLRVGVRKLLHLPRVHSNTLFG